MVSRKAKLAVEKVFFNTQTSLPNPKPPVMNEQLKQQIESWILQDQRRVDKQSHLGLCLLVLQQISILRHADPEIMKQAGWVREEEIRRRLEIIMSEPNGQVRETMISNLLI